MKLAEFIQDDNGKLSMGRICVGIVTISYVIYGGIEAMTSNTIPDMPLGVSALVSALYASSKFSRTNRFERCGNDDDCVPSRGEYDIKG